MPRALARPGRRLLAGLLALAATGCAIDEAELQSWPAIANGQARLAAYLADDHRPPELRAQAATLLIGAGGLDHLMSVAQDATPEQRGHLLDWYANAIVDILTKLHTPAEQANAAGLAYYVLEYADALRAPARGGGPLDAALVDTLVDWCLTELAKPPTERAKTPRKLEDILLAALVARPALAATRVAEKMRAADDLGVLLSMNALLARVEDPELRRTQATHLLAYARKKHPDVPPALAQAMVDNRNPTLLHYLLDTTRDPRVPLATREIGLLAAKNLLKADALGGLVLLLRADDPANQNIFRLNALDYAWDLGGTARLADSLQALPQDGTWWPDGVMFRAHVDSFCDHKLGPARDDVRPVLERLVDDPNWVTRAYAMRCVERLYPADAAALLAPLQDDETPLPGWDATGPTTLGAHARAVIAASKGG